MRLRDKDLVTLLLKAGASPNKKAGTLEITLLLLAALHNQPAITELLLTYKANPNFQDLSGETALMLAARKGYDEIVAKLLAHKANPNLQDMQGFTALHLNVSNNENADITKMLLDAGADPDIKNKSGKTAANIADERYGLYSEQLRLLEQASKKRKTAQEKK